MRTSQQTQERWWGNRECTQAQRQGTYRKRMAAWKANWRDQGQADPAFPLDLLSANRHSSAGNMKEAVARVAGERLLTMRRRWHPNLKLFTNLTGPPTSALCSSQTLSPLVKRPLDLCIGVLVPHGSMRATWEHRNLGVQPSVQGMIPKGFSLKGNQLLGVGNVQG